MSALYPISSRVCDAMDYRDRALCCIHNRWDDALWIAPSARPILDCLTGHFHTCIASKTHRPKLTNHFQMSGKRRNHQWLHVVMHIRPHCHLWSMSTHSLTHPLYPPCVFSRYAYPRLKTIAHVLMSEWAFGMCVQMFKTAVRLRLLLLTVCFLVVVCCGIPRNDLCETNTIKWNIHSLARSYMPWWRDCRGQEGCNPSHLHAILWVMGKIAWMIVCC